MAATCPVSACDCPLAASARASATQPPVIAAVRVPPSASSTSQSTVTVSSSIASRSTTARRLRPISRSISLDRPEGPLRSRRARRSVEPGSIAYSAVTQPPSPRKGGEPSSTDAAQSTWVPPKRARAEPAGWRWASGSSWTARSSSARRPSARGMGGSLSGISGLPTLPATGGGPTPTGGAGSRGGDLVAREVLGQLHRPVEGGTRLRQHGVTVGRPRDVGEDQPGHAGLGCDRARLGAGEVDVGRVLVRVAAPGGLAQEQVGPPGDLHQIRPAGGVAGVDDRRALHL